MTTTSRDGIAARERAAFCRTALLLGLMRGEPVVRWADEEIARSTLPLPVFIELATTPPDDLTAMRQVLFTLSGEHASLEVIEAVLGLIGHHLAAGRRSVTDTVAVLAQLRSMVRLPPEMIDDVRRLELEAMRSGRTGDTAALQASVGRWVAPFVGREARFLAGGGT